MEEKAKIAQKGPYIMDTPADTYIWCGCGLSKDQPFCDNAHVGTVYENSKNAAMKVDVEEDGVKSWCGCKQTNNPPWCDGTDKTL